MSESTVRFSTIALPRGQGSLGIVTLDRPKALNALDHNMIRELLAVCDQVTADLSIKGLWIESSLERAFCVGGDVLDVTNHGQRGGLDNLTFPAAYLADEYALDIRLRQLKIPVFAWGDGYVMGGGMGIFQSADVRLVTEHSNLAMPEVRIGFIPDCGGSWFLNRVTHGLGVCLAMSGATVTATDAVWLNLADWLLPRIEKETVFQTVLSLNYSSKASALDMLGQLLSKATEQTISEGPWEVNGIIMANSIRHLSPRSIWTQLMKWHEVTPQLFLGLDQSSSGVALIAGHQFFRARYQSIIGSAIQEHDLGMRLLLDGEWCEGVRALLVDKDKNPQWRFASVDVVDDDWIKTILAPMTWEGGHPLVDRLNRYNIEVIP